MKSYIIKISVDEDKVRKAAGDNDLESAILTEAGWMQESGIFAESVEEVSEKKAPRKYILITTDRENLALSDKEFSSTKAAHDEMLKQILNQSDYSSEEELIDAVYAGEAGYSDDEAWVSHSSCDTIVWKIITV